MSTSLEALPLELVASVIDFLAGPRRDPDELAPYATISAKWQQAIEQQTYASLDIKSLDLESFERFVSNSHAHRRAALRTIGFTVVLPAYSDAACACYEKDSDKQLNNEVFSEAIARLFKALEACEDVYKPGPITLRIHESYALSDLRHRGAEKYAADVRAYEVGGREDLWEHRYEHSYLRLLDFGDFPYLGRVNELSVCANGSRSVEPAVAVALATRLPNLATIFWRLNDCESKFTGLRTRLRYDFGQSLQTLDLQSAKSLHLQLLHVPPCDHDFVVADVRGSDAAPCDSLSASLRSFIQGSNLTKITLGGPICLDAGIFRKRQPFWPSVQFVCVDFSTIRPDGAWYFDRDASAPLESPSDESDVSSEPESSSGYDSSDSFFKVDVEVPDTYNERKEERLTATPPSPHRPAAYSTMTATDAGDNARAQGGQKPMLARQRANQEAEAQGKSQPKSGYFPLGYKEGLSQWWAGLSPAVTEHKVLSFIPYLRTPPTHTQTGSDPAGSKMSLDTSSAKEADPVRTTSNTDPYGPRQWNSKLVQLAGKDRFLNEFSVERLGEETENNLVMLHGYGAGLGFYYKNFEGLSRLPHWKLYALDMLGMGRSSRPPFRIHAKDKIGKIREAESWFVDALEQWRIEKGIDKMTLLGHSLGGYMAVCYALKYPGHLNKLILASPVGIPEDPYAVNEDLPEPGDSTMANEFAQSQNEAISGKRPGDQTSLNAGQKAAQNGKQPPRRPTPKWLTTLWDANISPFSVVRLAGPIGPRLVSGWTSRRFGSLPADEAQALHDYSYSLFRQKGSGEYALAYVLAPGAFARSPLIRRIQGVGRQYLEVHSQPEPDAEASSPSHKARETGVPIVMLYGDHDWMDIKGGYASKEKLEEEKEKALANATSREKQLENGSVKVVQIRNAGHHVYLDGSEQFNEEILDEMRDVEKRQKRLAAVK
ncbi:hypothetical protein LTR08_000085 [Meristemomyces frigidus]|nr:hypothetical protein LTR08_000085 [Meristemomyces frigidus]